MALEIRRCVGNEVSGYLEDAARLRIRVFREFPYLYEGDVGYEREYLSGYAESGRAVVVVALEGKEVVGISTGLPMEDADRAFQAPFLAAGEVPEEWFYFGESVLAPEWRGRGVGHRFFDEREAHARELGLTKTAFCAVVRPEDHPLRPPGYVAHDRFWMKRGYIRRPGWRAKLDWRQVDSAGEEVENELVFWTREAGQM